jgi:UDP-N-acetylglucosamine 4,6-dehydratase
VRVIDLAQVIAPECAHEIIGIRPGEKLHEVLIPEDDARLTIEFEDHYIIQPSHSYWNHKDFLDGRAGKPCPDGFKYSSDTNTWWLNDDEIAKLVAQVAAEPSPDIMPQPTEPRFIIGG